MREQMIRVILAAAVALLCGAAHAGKGSSSDRASIDGVGEGLMKAVKARDLNTVMSFYADHFQSSTVSTKTEIALVYRTMMGRYDSIRITRVRVSLEVRSPHAREVADERLVARSKDGTQGISITQRRLISYERVGDQWLITGEEEIDVAAETLIKGNAYNNERQGLALRTPPSWSLHVLRTALMSLVLITSPDLTCAVNIGRLPLPEGTTAENVLKDDLEAAKSSFKGVKEVSRNEIEIAGRKGHQIVTDIAHGGRTPRISRSYVSDSHSLIFVIVSAESAKAFDAVNETVGEILGTLRLANPKADPALGTMKDRTFVNEKIGCSLQLPNGWDAAIAKGPGHFKLSMSADNGALKGTFVCLPTKRTSVELVVMGDEHTTSSIGAGYELLEDGHVHCATGKGYGTLSTFTIRGTSRARRRAYFKTGGYLFCLIIDVSPPPFYKKYALAVENMVKSITLPK